MLLAWDLNFVVITSHSETINNTTNVTGLTKANKF